MNGRDKQRTVGSLYHEHTLMRSEEIATVETDLFEHREVKPHFINDCCFGEDFAAWLRQRLADLSGFEFSEPIQEDSRLSRRADGLAARVNF